MTINEAISRVDELKPNTASRTDKIRWLSQIDSMVKEEIIMTHYPYPQECDTAYNDETPGDTELLVKSPYDDIYVKWLEAQIDYYSGEVNRYNNSIVMFNELYREYNNWYNRKYMPRGARDFRYY